MKKLFATAMMAAALWTAQSPAQADDSLGVTGTECPSGSLMNMVLAALDINLVFPITIMGVSVGSSVNPPLMYEPPVCACPSVLGGLPSPGVGSTYWQPRKIIEVQRTAGCMEMLGGLNIFASTAFKALNSEQTTKVGIQSSSTNRMQVHEVQYPVFTALNVFSSLSCKDASGFKMAYATEIDYPWQSDEWSVMITPEAAFFSDSILQASCSVDSVAAELGFPLSAMFWCQGAGGTTYPLSGNSQHNNSPFQMNNSIQSKYLARQARLGMEWTTIGPVAMCYAHPSPIWVKEQYRINQALPVARKGKPLYVGGTGLGQFPEQANMPTRESTSNFIWQGQQCCARTY